MLAAGLGQTIARADDESAATGTNAIVSPESIPGFFSWLDARSAYYRDFFPEPLLVEDTGLEEGEIEFNELHTQANDQQSDVGEVEVQKSFGLMTFNLDLPYERYSDADDVAQGIGNVELGARYPLYQKVSANGWLDDTLGAELEVGIPVNSQVSQNAELEPEVFNDLRLTEHFSLQTVLGYSTLFGGGDQGGLQTFEYGFAFGYLLTEQELRLPGVQDLTLLLELSGERQMNQENTGDDSLLGSLGFRLNFKPLGELQSSLGLGWIFPVDNGAREEVHWGIATSLIFGF